jgi:hypothetical protein
VADGAVFDLDPAATTAPLPSTWQIQAYACLYRGIGQQGADLNLDYLARGFKDNNGF